MFGVSSILRNKTDGKSVPRTCRCIHRRQAARVRRPCPACRTLVLGSSDHTQRCHGHQSPAATFLCCRHQPPEASHPSLLLLLPAQRAVATTAACDFRGSGAVGAPADYHSDGAGHVQAKVGQPPNCLTRMSLTSSKLGTFRKKSNSRFLDLCD